MAIEGLGPSPAMLEKRLATPPEVRIGHWIETLRGLSARTPRKYPTIADALARMREENLHLSEPQARHLTIHGVAQNEDGTYSWKFDNYVRAFNPVYLSAEASQALYGRITSPTLLMRGMESWASTRKRTVEPRPSRQRGSSTCLRPGTGCIMISSRSS